MYHSFLETAYMNRISTAIFMAIALSALTTFASGHESEDIEGIWQGTLKYPGLELRIAFRFSAMPDGRLQASMMRPDESEIEIPVRIIILEGSNLQLEVAPGNGSFEGQIQIKEGIIQGQWRQGQRSQPLILKRVSEIAKPARPQTPIPPYPYNEEDVTFVNREANIELAGTLTWPKEEHSCPAVILIPGVGAHDRDYFILGHRPFLVMSDYLTRRGIAVLRFDERGVGASKGDRSQATSEDYARDVMAGVNFLKTRKEINPHLIGLIGHSEGGTIAPLAAAGSSDVAYIVMMGSPGLPGVEYNYQYEESMSRALGLSEEAIVAKRAFQERALDVVLHEKDYDVAEEKLRRIYQEFHPHISDMQKKAAVKRLLSPWFRFNVTHDPGATLRAIKCPVLAVIGEKDVHVPPDGNIEAIRDALETGDNRDYRVEQLPGLNHFFQTAETGAPLEYGKIEETISPTVLELVGDWILEYMKGSGQDDRTSRRNN
jgi:pimeloyl-ACP methyl ester carboxylesterase